MHRTEGPDEILESGKRRYKETPAPGTVVNKFHANALQEEICLAIEDAGITLAASGAADRAAGWGQLKDAINAKVAAADAHITADGKDHSDVVLNNTHRSGDGSDHADVATNTTHSGSDGKDHSDVVLNNTHRAIVTGNPHVVVASQISDFAEGVALYPNKADAGNDITAQAGSVGGLSQLITVKRIGNQDGGFVLIEFVVSFTLSGGPSTYFKIDLDDVLGSYISIQGNSTCILDIGGTEEIGKIHGSSFGGEMTIHRLNAATFPNGAISILGNFVGTTHA